MTLRGWAYGFLTGATLTIYAVMALVTLAFVANEAGGMRPFDLRPTGYTLAEAEAFLSKLSDVGRVVYLRVQHPLDLAYPLLLAMWLAVTIRLCTPGWPRWSHGLVAVLAVASAGFDYLENARVAGLLQAEAVSEAAVRAASDATVAKSALGGGLLVLTLVLVLRAAWRWNRGRA